MYSYTATIGRNYSTGTAVLPSMRGQAMPLTLWEQFIEDVKADMLRFAAESAIHVEAVEVHRGKGVWEGVEEDSSKITILTSARSDNLDILRNYLSENARHYGQDAIALTVGQSELC